MSKLTKKIVAIATALTVLSMVVGPTGVAQGAISAGCRADVNTCTTAELTEYIAELTTTMAALTAKVNALEGGTTGGTVTGCTITSFDANLQQGDSGAAVKCLQIILNSDSETQLAASGVGSVGNETTYFGPLTKAAVVKFQVKHAAEVLTPIGLTAGTGFVGPKTRAKLNSMMEGGAVTLPEGCTSTSGYSPITGQSCATGGVVTLPEGCTSTSGYSPITGQSCGTGGVVTGPGLTASLAADNPAAQTIVADTTEGDGAQALISALKVTFSNGNASEVKVTKVAFKRTGISADADISAAALYAGDTWLADYNSFNSGVLTFNNAAGVFTVPAGSARIVTLKVDLANGTASGKTIKFSIAAVTDIESDASAINGTYPLTGNFLSTATTADLGKLVINATSSASAAIDPQDGLDVFGFNLVGSNQIINVTGLKFTIIGSVAYNDLTNLKLYDSGTQIGSTMQMESDKTVTFDLSASPIAIGKGVTKNMHVKADITGGTNRNFKLSIQGLRDIVAYDTQYSVYIKPNMLDSWAVLYGTVSTISTGKLTITRASDAPSGNIPLNGTNITVAKFSVKATGEDVKITGLSIAALLTHGLYQGQIYFDGSQVGVTTNLASSSATAFTFGNTLVVPADGANHTILIRSDVKRADAAAYSGNETITPQISSVTATGKTSLATVSVGTATGYQLTIKTGTLSTAKDQSVPDWSQVANPTTVAGANQVLIGSFIVSAGASEGADITAIKITDDGALLFGNIQNINLYNGTKESGVQIGSTQGTVVTATTYTFYPSPYISLAANDHFTLKVYANVNTATTTANGGYVALSEVDGTGKTTNTSVNYTTSVNGQLTYIVDTATLTVALDTGATPKVGQILAGTNGVEFTKAKVTGGLGEAISVTQVIVTATFGSSTQQAVSPTSTIKNISLWDTTVPANPVQVGGTNPLNSQGKATFDLSGTPWAVGVSEVKTLTMKADVQAIAYATSGGTVLLGIAAGDITYKGETSGLLTTTTAAGAVTGSAMYVYKTKLTFGPNSSTPSGVQGAAANKTVMTFEVTNNGSYTGYLNGATFAMTHTPGAGGNATSQAARIFYLYDGADLTSYIASTSFPIAQTYNASTVTPVLINTYTAGGYEIPAGTTKVFALVGDTTDMGTGTAANKTYLTFYVNDGTAVNWDDGLTGSVSSAYSKAFPISGGTLEYPH